MSNSDNSTPFQLKNSNETFLQRQKNVFDQLNALKSTLHNNVLEDMEVEESPVVKTETKKSRRSATKHLRGKESIFKRPEAPILRNYMKNIPDFKKNPHKWKKYSLADVKDEDMSETCNTKTALAFLNELKKRNEEKIADEYNEEPKKIIFKKKSVVDDNASKDSLETKATFRSSKLLMPEYEVGQKVKKEKKPKKVNKEGSTQLKLDHLLDEEDDE